MGYNYEEMKPALIAAIVLAVVICLAPRSKAKEYSSNIAAKEQRNSPVALVPFAKNDKTKGDNQSSENEPPSGDTPAQWILVIVTAGFIGWQAWETRKAANAAGEAAESLVSIERARILLDSNELPQELRITCSGAGIDNWYETRVHFRNYGRTMGRITAFSVRKHVIPDDQSLPGRPEYAPEKIVDIASLPKAKEVF